MMTSACTRLWPQFFILGGQVAYVAEVGEPIKAPNGETDARLRVVYSNGTERNLLLRSLQRALYKDEGGRRITEPNAGPLFADTIDDEDLASGTLYVVRSKSEEPYVAEHRELLHRSGSPAERFRHALPMPDSMRRSCSPMSRWLPPTACSTSTA